LSAKGIKNTHEKECSKMEILAKRIKELRKEYKMTQADLA